MAFRPRLGGGCHSLKLFCTLAVVPAMTQQSLLQEVMVGTVVMLAAFPLQGTEPHGMSVASEITLGYLPGHLPEETLTRRVGELFSIRSRNGIGKGRASSENLL